MLFSIGSCLIALYSIEIFFYNLEISYLRPSIHVSSFLTPKLFYSTPPVYKPTSISSTSTFGTLALLFPFWKMLFRYGLTSCAISLIEGLEFPSLEMFFSLD